MATVAQRLPDDLSPRRRPSQQRARDTYDRLLDAAAEILAESGIEALNTNAVADRAGVTVPTVYRYFPNKHALLVALAESYVESEKDWLFAMEAVADPNHPLDAAIREVLGGYASHADEFPGVSPLRAAMRALPELAPIEAASLEASSKRLADALRSRAPELDRKRVLELARLIVSVSCSEIDRTRGMPARARRARLRDLADMFCAYVSSTVD